MKRVLLAISCLLLISTITVNATVSHIETKPPKVKSDSLTEEQRVRIQALKNRVAEIEAIDKSKLSKADRKALRQELKEIKKEANGNNKGFILALGGIIVAILLLILLL